MRRVLLDTHTFVWAVSAPERLGETAREVLSEPTTTLLVSAVSAWELSIKVRAGKFASAAPIVERFNAICATLGAPTLAIAADHGLLAGSLDWAHKDPFDRMLAAQALIENVPLITRDRAFADVSALPTIW